MKGRDRIIMIKRTVLIMVMTICTVFTGCSNSEVSEIYQDDEVIEEEKKTEKKEIEKNQTEEAKPEEIELIRKAETNDYLTVRELSYYPSGDVGDDTRYEYYDNGAYKSMKMELLSPGFESGHIYIDYNRPSEPGNIEICKTYGNNVGDSTITDYGYYNVIYNSEWKVICQELVEPNSSKPTETIKYTYDSSGNILERTQEGETYRINTKYEYNEYNVLISMDEDIITSRNSGEYHYAYYYDYDDEGLPLIRYEYLNGEKYSTTKIYRDDAGLICKEEQTDSKGLVSCKEYERYTKEEYISRFLQ